MATATPPTYWRRWAWIVPPNIIALPWVHEGFWWIVDLKTDECSYDPVETARIRLWALDRGADLDRRTSVASIPYFLNPWPRLFDEFVDTIDDASTLRWFDPRPIYKLRRLNGTHREQPSGHEPESPRLRCWH